MLYYKGEVSQHSVELAQRNMGKVYENLAHQTT